MPSSRELERAEDATEDPLDLAARAASVRRERSRALAFPESHPKQSGGEERPLKTIMKAAGQRREREKAITVKASPLQPGQKANILRVRSDGLSRGGCVTFFGPPRACAAWACRPHA